MNNNSIVRSHIAWCLQQKRGIRIEEPNDNLSDVYIKKAISSLNMLESAIEKNEIEWISTTAYYARYFAVYAMLQKCGIRSEIHDCTISLLQLLFVEEKIIETQYYNEMKRSKELRIEIQYYTSEKADIKSIKKDSLKATNFVLKIEEIIEKLNDSLIGLIRQKLIAC
ncbi:MAG: HEPN domain-containing protein [Candidatus Woesearchaeota archaeon]